MKSDFDEAQPIIITPTILRQLHDCHRRVWLDAYGDAAQRDEIRPALDAQFRSGVEHEEIVHRTTSGSITTTLVRSWAEGVELTAPTDRQPHPERDQRLSRAHLPA